MIIHSFLTDGFYDWSVFFLQSLKKYNKEKYKVIFDTMGLNGKQINQLKSIYNNFEIRNKPIDIDEFVSLTKFNKEDAIQFKKDVELKHSNLNKFNKTWKQWISVEKRYRDSIIKIMNENPEQTILHVDIDTVFVNNINQFENFIEQHDVSFKFRAKQTLDKRRIVGGFIGLKSNENGFKFVNKWIEEINKKKLKDKPLGYGQYTLFTTYKQLKDEIDIGVLPFWFTANNKNYKKRKKFPLVISANKVPKNKILKEMKVLVNKK